MRLRHPNTEAFGGLRFTLAVSAFVAGASFCLASDAWHSQPSFFYINRLPIPWWVYGTMLVIGAGCLFFEKTRPGGFLIGAILYTFFAIATWLAVLGGLHLQILFLNSFPPDTVGSFFGAGNVTTICVLYWSALKYAIYVQVDPERGLNYKK